MYRKVSSVMILFLMTGSLTEEEDQAAFLKRGKIVKSHSLSSFPFDVKVLSDVRV